MKTSFIQRNKTFVHLAMAILVIFLISGCSSTSWSPFAPKSATSQNGEPFTTNVHTGTDGIVLNFASGSPPSTVYYTGPGTPFDIILEMRNRGATDIMQGYLYLSGYDKNIIRPLIISPSGWVFGKNNGIYFSNLEGVSNFNPEGEYTTIEFQNDIVDWPSGTDSYSPVFRASACYRYQTKANPVVCIDPKPFSSLDEKKTCRVANVPMGGGQGGPIQVTLVEEEATEQNVYFRIHISNAQAAGTVYDYTKVDPLYPDPCPFNIQYRDINKVHYSAPSFTGNDPHTTPTLVNGGCKPESPVRLVNNQATIYCQFNIPAGLQEAYQTPLNLAFDYGYLNYIEQTIRIKNAGSS